MLRGASREAAITEEFFRVLDRVQSIHSNGRMLMQSGHQTAALEIMEQMALYQVYLFIYSMYNTVNNFQKCLPY